MNKGFIFDWSGTLINNFPSFCQTCGCMFKELGREPITPDEIRLYMTSPYMKFWNKYFPDLTKEKQDSLFATYFDQSDEPDLFASVPGTIRYLYDSGHKLFVVSSDPSPILNPQIERSNLSKYFTEVVAGDYEKKETAKSLVEKYGLDPKCSYFVGDCTGDIEAGKAANLKTIGLIWGFEHKDRLVQSNPDFLFDDILAIKDLLANNDV